MAPLFLFMIRSCTFFTTPYENEAKISVEHIEAAGEINYRINVKDGPVDIIFSFTNINESGKADTPDVDEKSITVNGVSFPAPTPQALEFPEENLDPFAAFIQKSSDKLLSKLQSKSTIKNVMPKVDPPSYDIIGDTSNFIVPDAAYRPVLEAATCRYVSAEPIQTAQGKRTLNIWVADDCWLGPGPKRHYINSDMVLALANRFLKDGLDNDIYDWVTNILGPEWGNTGYNNLIASNNEITILLSDIIDEYGDNIDDGGAVGYFTNLHNFTADFDENSNERIMFVVDAVMYANPSNEGYAPDGTSWSTADYWPKIVFSTLAHEFQHMVHFYQKTVLRAGGRNTEAWINEMCSMLIEDFLADKMGVEGPRGVAPADPTAGPAGNEDGRIPFFNKHLFRSVIVKDNAAFYLEDYSTAYALGAWLARNYGGVDFLRNVALSDNTDKTAIEQAVRDFTGGEETFERLLERWGAAIFLSNKTEAPPLYRYNSGGWFSSSSEGNSYNLGSINLYNYYPAPDFATSPYQLANSLTKPGSNVYLLAAQNATGELEWDIEVPEDVRLTVIFKGR